LADNLSLLLLLFVGAMKHSFKLFLFRLYDCGLILISLLYLPLLKKVRKYGVQHFPLHKKSFEKIGVFPIQDLYYDPQFIFPSNFDANKKRKLYLDFNIDQQLENLSKLKYTHELLQLNQFPTEIQNGVPVFYMQNPAFGPGDADMYYLMIRNLKPKHVVEIGSGYSTMLALAAVRKNKEEGFETKLTCIEPYETSWLEQASEIELIRNKVEEVDISLFTSLSANDILFIDSSHIIRPNNDVLFEYLELLPQIGNGVYIHIHDIFSPRNYRQDWITGELRFWNEQYLLEAFLYNNPSFEITFSLNYLRNDYFELTKLVLKNLNPESQPASFWIKRL